MPLWQLGNRVLQIPMCENCSNNTRSSVVLTTSSYFCPSSYSSNNSSTGAQYLQHPTDVCHEGWHPVAQAPSDHELTLFSQGS
ncbi:hypothetical protein FKM82_026277 [Ascaphus truei]